MLIFTNRLCRYNHSLSLFLSFSFCWTFCASHMPSRQYRLLRTCHTVARPKRPFRKGTAAFATANMVAELINASAELVNASAPPPLSRMKPCRPYRLLGLLHITVLSCCLLNEFRHQRNIFIMCTAPKRVYMNTLNSSAHWQAHLSKILREKLNGIEFTVTCHLCSICILAKP